MNKVLIESCSDFLYERFTFDNINESILTDVASLQNYKAIIEKIKTFFQKIKNWILKIWGYIKRLFVKNPNKEKMIKELIDELKRENFFGAREETDNFKILTSYYYAYSGKSDSVESSSSTLMWLSPDDIFYGIDRSIDKIPVDAYDSDSANMYINHGEENYYRDISKFKDLVNKLKSSKIILISDYDFDKIKEFQKNNEVIIKRLHETNEKAKKRLEEFMNNPKFSDEIKQQVNSLTLTKISDTTNIVMDLLKYATVDKIYNDSIEVLGEVVRKIKDRRMLRR
jgi:hypothetical protein